MSDAKTHAISVNVAFVPTLSARFALIAAYTSGRTSQRRRSASTLRAYPSLAFGRVDPAVDVPARPPPPGNVPGAYAPWEVGVELKGVRWS